VKNILKHTFPRSDFQGGDETSKKVKQSQIFDCTGKELTTPTVNMVKSNLLLESFELIVVIPKFQCTEIIYHSFWDLLKKNFWAPEAQ